MFKRLLYVVFAAFSITVARAETLDDDAVVARLATEVLDRVSAVDDVEVAAFIVRGDDGTLSLAHWPNRHRFREAQWTGPAPAGVVAIIHTHPHRSPLPSTRDAREARRLNLPFYVVSRASLCVVSPEGRLRRARHLPWLSRSKSKKNDVVRLGWQDRGVILT
jgi:proteasome lid subunit RPN8/RPN11